ncbi:MAG: FlgT C-terminal domain-containing protein [FCB group bacterium]|jgi:tetratricopeptide (TPR) repeat protein|nr:FlgT C-terminal domain-containing protein [FCB group bacterium]
MKRLSRALLLITCLAISLQAGLAYAELKKGSDVPNIQAKDIKGNEVDLYAMLDKSPDDLAILFFFTTQSGEIFAERLRELKRGFGDSDLRIIAIGLKEEEAALKAFADKLKIDYYLIADNSELSAESKYGPFTSLPVTFVVAPRRTLVKEISGGGEGEADILTYVAHACLMTNKPAQAEKAADVAIKEGETAAPAREAKGYAQVQQGKLDAAAQEFQQIDSKTGLAAVAMGQGDYAKAAALADEATGDPYAPVIKGEAMLRAGKPEEAQQAFGAAAPTEDWKKNAAVRGEGRAMQEQGNLDGAIAKYGEALEINPADVTALSNESAAHQAKGDLKGAEAALARAEAVSPNDQTVAIMLRQIRQEMENANNTKRRELIQKQIADLQQRYKDLKAAGKDKPADDWSSRPLVVAFLPTERQPIFFERAGTDVAIQRELEARLRENPRFQVVEREVLDTLLQELNLGSSDLANPDTQLRLGKVLSAQLLGFADFAQTGPEAKMYLRMVNTETTSIDTQISKALPPTGDVGTFVDDLTRDLTDKVLAARPLQGIVADATSPEEIWINLGKIHGLQPGQQFVVIRDGAPIEAGGKVIGHRPDPVGTLEVTTVDEQASACKVIKKKEGVDFTKEMRIKETK